MEIEYNVGYKETLKDVKIPYSAAIKSNGFYPSPLIARMPWPSLILGAKGISSKPRFDYNSCAYTSTNTLYSISNLH